MAAAKCAAPEPEPTGADAAGMAKWKALILPAALTMVAFVYGSWALIASAALAGTGVNPLVLASYRCVAGAFVMLGGYRLLRWLGRPDDEKPGPCGLGEIAAADWPRFALLGLLMACNIGGNIMALKLLPALTVSVCQPMLPVVAGVASALLGIERLSPPRVGGILLATLGAIVVVAMGAHSQAHGVGVDGDAGSAGGLACLLVNVFGGALYAVFQKGIIHTYQPALAASAAFFAAACVLSVGAVCTAGLDAAAWRLQDNGGALRALLFSVFLTTAFNYVVQAWAVRESSPTTVTSFMTLQPAAAALLSWLVLGKPPTSGQALGGAAIVLGLGCFVAAPAPKPMHSED